MWVKWVYNDRTYFQTDCTTPTVSESTCSQQIAADLSEDTRIQWILVRPCDLVRFERHFWMVPMCPNPSFTWSPRHRYDTDKTCQKNQLANSKVWFAFEYFWANLLVKGLRRIWVWRAWDKVKNHHMLTVNASQSILEVRILKAWLITTGSTVFTCLKLLKSGS